MIRKNLILKILLVIFLIISFCTLLTLLIVTVFGIFSRTNEEPRVESDDFRLLMHNPITNETTTSIATLPKISFSEGNEFITYENEGIYSLISPFESRSFKCSGSCVCYPGNLDNDDTTRRGSAVAIRNGVLYLLTAVTSLVAYQKAVEYFDDECKSQLASDCEDGTILSKVDECDEIIEDFNKNMRIGKYSGEESESTGSEGDTKAVKKVYKGSYLCEGRCSKNKIFKDPSYLKGYEKINCERLFHASGIDMDLYDEEDTPEGIFLDEKLREYCRKGSQYFRYGYEVYGKMNRPVYLCKGEISKVKCTGSDDVSFVKRDPPRGPVMFPKKKV